MKYVLNGIWYWSLFLMTVFSLLFPSLAQARSSDDKLGLSTSGGIVAPGAPTAVLQNPAGLVQGSGWSLIGQGGGDDSFNHPVVRGGLLGGGGNYGLAAEVEQTTSKPEETSALYGLGVRTGKLTLGLAGRTPLSPSGDSTFNTGLIYNENQFQIGATLFGLNNGVDEIGAGIATDSNGGTLNWVLDTAYNRKNEGFGVKPGVRVGSPEAALTLSYGFADAKKTMQLSDGFSAGGALKVGQSATFQAYYNVFQKFYGGLTLGF